MSARRLMLMAMPLALGLALAWSGLRVAGAEPPSTRVRSFCTLQTLAPFQPSEFAIGPFSKAPGLVYTSTERVQIGPWHPEGERILLVEDDRDHRQTILSLNPASASRQIHGQRNLSNSRPFWQDDSVFYMDWAVDAAGEAYYRLLSEHGLAATPLALPHFDLAAQPANLPTFNHPTFSTHDSARTLILPATGPQLIVEGQSCDLDLPGLRVLDAAWSESGDRLALIATATQPDQARGRGAQVLSTRLIMLDFEAGTQQVWRVGPKFAPGQRYATDVAWQPGTDVLALIVLTGLDALGLEASALYFIDAGAGTAAMAPEGEWIGGADWGRQLAWSPDGRVLLASCPTRREGRVCGYGLAGRGVLEDIKVLKERGSSRSAKNSTMGVFTPPISVTVEIYRLSNSGAVRQPATFCTPGDTSYGCTSFCSETGFGCPETVILDYPFENPTVTLNIENDYLRDVVPQEMGTYYDQNALEAQAVAARTFAYYNIENPFSVHFNNSISFQAFIPRRLERLIPVNYPDDADNRWDDPCGADLSSLNFAQLIICSALESPDWMSYLSEPIKAHFAADVPGHTNSSSRPYILGLPDPISTACDTNLAGHGWGMSQEGASRWGRGNECSYPGAPVYAGNDPGGPWSVSFNRDQILTHYYSLVQIRDPSGDRLSPDLRWLPIHAIWSTSDGLPPPLLGLSGTVNLDLRIQNAGVSTWLTGTTGLIQTWTGLSGTYTTVMPLATALVPPSMLTLTLPIQPPPFALTGSYTVTLDMAIDSGSGWTPFASLEPERPWYVLMFATSIVDLREWVALPVVIEAGP